MERPEAGTHVLYVRNEGQEKKQYDATILGYEIQQPGEVLPSVQLAFLNPANASIFVGSVDWWRAFEHVFSVPFNLTEGAIEGHHHYELQDFPQMTAVLVAAQVEIDGLHDDLALAKKENERLAAELTAKVPSEIPPAATN